MPPIVFALIQGLLLVLLYLFVARAVRTIWKDVSATAAAGGAAPARGKPAKAPAKRKQRAAPGELVIHTPQGRPRVVRLEGHDVTFGRSETSTVALDDAYISDHHAKVFLSDGEWRITDLGSTNGTFLNQVKVTSPTPIAAGDQLGIGKTTVQVRK